MRRIAREKVARVLMDEFESRKMERSSDDSCELSGRDSQLTADDLYEINYVYENTEYRRSAESMCLPRVPRSIN